jgi:hypothetical protein
MTGLAPSVSSGDRANTSPKGTGLVAGEHTRLACRGRRPRRPHFGILSTSYGVNACSRRGRRLPHARARVLPKGVRKFRFGCGTGRFAQFEETRPAPIIECLKRFFSKDSSGATEWILYPRPLVTVIPGSEPGQKKDSITWKLKQTSV